MFDINIISTGSKGNCVVIDNAIMCDAGLSKKKISEAYDLDNLKILMISHKHADHTNLPFIRWALKNDIEVHLPQDVVDMLIEEGRISLADYNENLYIHDAITHYNRTLQKVDENDEVIETEYDIHMHPQKHYDIVNYAFVIEKPRDDGQYDMYRLLYSTDLDTIQPTDMGEGLVSLGTFDVILLEGNYDEVWLRDYINLAIGSVDPDKDASTMTDKDLDAWVRENYRQLPRSISAELFRAVQNMRHLSKQQARIFVGGHIRENGIYYEVHRSSMFYERPDTWTIWTLDE